MRVSSRSGLPSLLVYLGFGVAIGLGVSVAASRLLTAFLFGLTPTDAVKDRLAAFFHWSDRQSLEQALATTA